MIVAMMENAPQDQIQRVIDRLVEMGFSVHRSTGERQTVLGVVGSRVDFDTRELELLPGVQQVHRISSPYKLAGRSFRPAGHNRAFARRSGNRRQAGCSNGRAMLGRITRTAF